MDNRVSRFFGNIKRGMTIAFSGGREGIAGFGSWYAGDSSTDTDETVTSTKGTKVFTVWECLNILAQDISTMPCELMKISQDGSKQRQNTTLARLINDKPNRYENAWQFWYGMVFTGEGWGNSYAYLLRNSRNEVEEMIRLDPSLVDMKVQNGKLYYVVDGGRWVIPERDVFHYRSFVVGANIKGISKIEYNANLMGLKMRQNKYTEKSTSEKVSGYLSTDSNLQEKQRRDIGEAWNSSVRGDKVNGTPFLHGGVKYNHIMLAPESAEIVGLADWSDIHTFGVWRIQPTMASNHKSSNYSNAEQQALNHVKFTLHPIVTALEQEANEKLISERSKQSTEPLRIFFDMKELLRGDTEAQAKWFSTMLTGGVINADEVRTRIGMQPQADGQGQVYYIQGAMIDKKAQTAEAVKGERSAKEMSKELSDLINRYELQS